LIINLKALNICYSFTQLNQLHPNYDFGLDFIKNWRLVCAAVSPLVDFGLERKKELVEI
jgi:hypothetical protein